LGERAVGALAFGTTGEKRESRSFAPAALRACPERSEGMTSAARSREKGERGRKMMKDFKPRSRIL